MKQKKDDSELEVFFTFRCSDFYLKHLNLLKSISQHCVNVICGLALQWLPVREETVNIKKKKQRSSTSGVAKDEKHESGLNALMQTLQPWSFSNWRKALKYFNESNQTHCDIVVHYIIFDS